MIFEYLILKGCLALTCREKCINRRAELHKYIAHATVSLKIWKTEGKVKLAEIQNPFCHKPSENSSSQNIFPSTTASKKKRGKKTNQQQTLLSTVLSSLKGVFDSSVLRIRSLWLLFLRKENPNCFSLLLTELKLLWAVINKPTAQSETLIQHGPNNPVSSPCIPHV